MLKTENMFMLLSSRVIILVQAVVLTFNASSNYWQYQYGVFYPNYYQVERATVTVTFSG